MKDRSIIPLAPVWHISLTHCYVECPICKSYNTAQDEQYVGCGKERHTIPVNLSECPECGQTFDWSDEAIEKAAKYARSYLEEVERRKKDGNKDNRR